MKQNVTVRQGALDGVDAFLSVARHRSFLRAAAELGDIGDGGFDAGLGQGQFSEADVIAVSLTPSHPLAVVGSHDYLRRRQRPERLDDLRPHACLRMRRSNGAIAPWSFVNGNEA